MASMNMRRNAPSLTSSYHTPRRKYDVFLSFRGEDTRKNFTSHLYAALQQKGIYTFVDNLRLEKGNIILPELFKAIEESRFSVIIFSENYASSEWCLDELAKILECMKAMGQKVLPVFYNVSPSEVRNQTGSFEKDFVNHAEIFREDIGRVRNWRAAMTEIAHLSGWHLQDREESVVIQEIVDRISSILGPSLLTRSEKLVGMDSWMEQMELFLRTDLNDVRILGICGMGGIGKTTLARVVFDKICYQFDGSSFLANVREVSMTQGLVSLQEKLIFEILREKNINIGDVYRGSDLICRRLRSKKVLVILDDVDQLEQLKALVGNHDWFGLGSRIIITSRDQHLLFSHGADNVYNVDKLSYSEAHQLFCWKAFRNPYPTDGYFGLSCDMVDYCDGLPLALEVLGSFLFNRSQVVWKNALDRVKEVPDRRIFEILKISYDGLQELEKKIFLDIACFFVGKDKNQVRDTLDGCDFYPDIGITVLIDKCIIKISNNKLRMHDLMKDMGREIIRQESPIRVGQRSRLWLYKDIYRVLTNNEGTEFVEGMVLDYPVGIFSGRELDAKSFSRMNNLRVLMISGGFLFHGLEYLSNELRLLKWHQYPLRYLPSNFWPEKICKFSMCYSYIEQLWKGQKNMFWLKIIKLSHSERLTRTPDFSGVPNLEKLVLDGCTSLYFLHPSIGLLRRLILLNLKYCKKLRSLPAEIVWESLEVLILSGCSKLSNIQESMGNARNLLQLSLDGSSIQELPSSIKHLTRLIKLNLRDCKNLVSLPSSICVLRSLEVLDLLGCSKLNELPENLGHVTGLEYLDFSRTAVCKPPSSIALLKNLKELAFHGCKGQVQKSWSSLFWFFSSSNSNSVGLLLPSLSGLCSLRKLDLSDCNIQEGAIPAELGNLPSLKSLNMSRNNFVRLPASISQLSKLETLNIEHCKKLQVLPELPASIYQLFAHNCRSLETILSPSNIFSSTSRAFDLSNCYKLTGNQGDNSTAITFFISLLQSLLKAKLQALKCRYSYTDFDIIVPGSQVPKWFSYQKLGASLSAGHSALATSNPCRGLAFCAAFSVQGKCASKYAQEGKRDVSMRLSCDIVINGSDGNFSSYYFPKDYWAEGDHLWLFYISPSLFTGKFRHTEILRYIKVSFSSVDFTSGVQSKVNKCGFRPVYDQEVEELIQATRFGSSFSTKLDCNRLAATNTIKRSSEHCWAHQQPHPKRAR